MAKYMLWLLLLSIAALLHFGYVDCCIEEERLALLELKAYMKLYSDTDSTDYGRHTSSSSSDCCEWNEVECNVTTGHVTFLDLRPNRVKYYNETIKSPWLFNVTIFHPFKDLVYLDLSNNVITGFNFQELANLKELRTLDLSMNNLNTTIQGLCDLRNLQQLELRYNLMYESLPSCIGNLSSLEMLDLSNNHFKGKLPYTLSNLTSLNYLDLSYNFFEGTWSLSSLANHSKLQVLRLSGNNLEVKTEDSTWLPTFQLRSLDLKGCNLNKPEGTIPKFLVHQYNLSAIDLSYNKLVGSFPIWLLSNNTQLKLLFLANNSLVGHLQLLLHAKISLKYLDISRNNIQGKVPENIGFILSKLILLNMSENHFEGQIPTSLGDLRELEYLDLSDNNFYGEIPRRLYSCDTLRVLYLSNNNLHGEMIPEDMNLPNLLWLKLSNNNLGGTIKNALQKSTHLNCLGMSYNKLTGELPQWIGNFSELSILSMSGNNLQGHIPRGLCKVASLLSLDLSHNNFSGLIPSCSNFSSLYDMHLQGNSLTGKIPSELTSCSDLGILDLKNNKLSGGIPYWINKLSRLTTLLLAGNDLHGQIPHQLCQLKKINILDLSLNNLSGRIPTCFWNVSFGTIIFDSQYHDPRPIGEDNIGDEDDIEFSSPQYNGQEEVEFLEKNQYLSYTGGVLVLMSGLDLSCNKLTGVIPPELGDLRELRSLNLSHNHLIGSIPTTFSGLNQIESLDLSCNNLTGTIPPQFVDLTFLSTFNVSYNSLTGRVPEAAQFTGFDERSYLGNPGLYGFSNNQLQNHSTTLAHDAPNKGRGRDENSEESYRVDFLWSFGMSCVIMFLATVVILYINPQWRQAWFDFVDFRVLWWTSVPLLSLE